VEKLFIKDYNLEINLPSIVNIIGLPGMGKTHLLKILINQIDNKSIYIDDKNTSELEMDFKKKNFTACLNLDFNTASVKEELVYFLGKCDFNIQDSLVKMDKFIKHFNLDEISDEKLINLSIYNKALIKILSLLIIEPKILGINNLLAYLSDDQKRQIISYAKKNKITILNITAEKEEFLLGDYLMIIEKGKVKHYGKTKTILADEKLLALTGFELPFVLNMSNGLNLYEIIDKSYYSLDSLVGAIWK